MHRHDYLTSIPVSFPNLRKLFGNSEGRGAAKPLFFKEWKLNLDFQRVGWGVKPSIRGGMNIFWKTKRTFHVISINLFRMFYYFILSNIQSFHLLILLTKVEFSSLNTAAISWLSIANARRPVDQNQYYRYCYIRPFKKTSIFASFFAALLQIQYILKYSNQFFSSLSFVIYFVLIILLLSFIYKHSLFIISLLSPWPLWCLSSFKSSLRIRKIMCT